MKNWILKKDKMITPRSFINYYYYFSKIVLINLKKSKIMSVKTKKIQGMINTEVGSQAKKCGVGTGCPTMAQVQFNLVSNTKGEEEEE